MKVEVERILQWVEEGKLIGPKRVLAESDGTDDDAKRVQELKVESKEEQQQ